MGRRYALLRAVNIALLVVAALLVWLKWQEPTPPVDNGTTGRRQGAGSPVAAAFDGGSLPATNPHAPAGTLYDKPGTWRDSQGRTVRLGELWGRPAVVAFIYTSCEDACPAVVEHVRAALRELPSRLRSRARVLLLSFDPERDTPRRLRTFAAEHGLPEPEWLLLTPRDEATARAAAEPFGIQFMGDGETVSHNTVIGAVDDRGRVMARVTTHLEQSGVLADQLRSALMP